MLYHVSPTAGLRLLQPRLSSHGRPYVYALENPVTALLFGAPKDDFDFLMDQDAGGVPQVWECYPGALERVYQGKSCSIYTLEEEGFQRGITGWEPELVCCAPVPVREEKRIADLYACLTERAKQGELMLHRYQDEPAYKRLISQHIVDRLIRFDALKHLETDPRFQKYYRPIILALEAVMDGHLL